MSTPPADGHTDLGVTHKFCVGPKSGRELRDLSNMGEVFLLALAIADADARRITLLSIEESRAIAELAAKAGAVMVHAIALVAASDAGEPKHAMRQHLDALCKATRTLTRKDVA